MMQVGCDVSEYRESRPSRIVESGVGFSRALAPKKILKMRDSDVVELLEGNAIDVDSIQTENTKISGGWLASYTNDFDPLPIWVGQKLTAMASEHERICRLEFLRRASDI